MSGVGTGKFSINSIVQVILDILIVNFSMLLAFYVSGENISVIESNIISIYQMIFTAVYIFIFLIFGLYNILWKFAGIRDLIKVSVATVAATVVTFCVFIYMYNYIGDYYKINTSAFFISLWMCVFILKQFTCLLQKYKSIYRYIKRKNANMSNVMIIGAGEAGAMLIGSMFMKNVNSRARLPVVIIDDDHKKHGTKIHGIPVVGDRYAIESVAQKYNINEIILTIPSSSKQESKKILALCAKTKCKLRTLPDLDSIMDENVNVNTVRDVSINDLLGRQEIILNNAEDYAYLQGKTVLVTGGGGTIGSELCRQIATLGVKKLIILDIYENNAYDLQQELKRIYKDTLDMSLIIASVQDELIIDDVFKQYEPNVVFHAAAHKHVPLMEDCPKAAIKNNVFGTLNVARAASKYGVSEFILISTDKAVNPTNVMGATKRVAEMIIQNYNANSKTKFAAVRFGNVLGSNGSVIPLFMKQIKEGGPVTVTDPDITRFFMTVNEAVQLVIQTGAITNGGEIFILDMGTPVKILELAQNLIALSGSNDIDIEFSGLRPGEKLYEELMMQEEGLISTKYKKIFVANPVAIDNKTFIFEIEFIQQILNNREFNAYTELQRLVPTYKSSNKSYKASVS